MAGEGALVGEGVEHAAAGSVAGDQRVIGALIEVESGLVATAQGDEEPAGPSVTSMFSAASEPGAEVSQPRWGSKPSTRAAVASSAR